MLDKKKFTTPIHLKYLEVLLILLEVILMLSSRSYNRKLLVGMQAEQIWVGLGCLVLTSGNIVVTLYLYKFFNKLTCGVFQ